jgi:hypothetical protein
MPSKTFAMGSVIFGLVWGAFFYPPGPKPVKAKTVIQQVATAR